MLGSPSVREGVSFKRVRQVHILEPYWNMSRYEQVIGRAIRFCSHKDLPIEKQVDKLCELIRHNEIQWDLFNKGIIKIKPKSYDELFIEIKNK